MNPLRRRRGVASVIGTMLFVLVLMAGLGAVAYVYSLQGQSSQAAQQAQQLLNQKGRESLTYQALSGGVLAVANAGSSASTIRYVILRFANGSVYQFTPNLVLGSGSLLSIPSLIPSQNCGLSTCLSKYDTILASTNAGNSVGVVTALGNVFWENPALAVQASTPGTTVQMTFTASGDSAFASNPVLVVDGTSYTQSQLPATMTWFVGTTHTYAWQSLPGGDGHEGRSLCHGLRAVPERDHHRSLGWLDSRHLHDAVSPDHHRRVWSDGQSRIADRRRILPSRNRGAGHRPQRLERRRRAEPEQPRLLLAGRGVSRPASRGRAAGTSSTPSP